jgi:Rrf2 family nitric oxide-sensitive transcriptional repressor
MHLVRRTQIAFQILRYLALREGGSASCAAMAKDIAISKVYVQKVANTLIKGKLIKGVRGVGGGLSLARPPAAIPVREVLTILDDASLRANDRETNNPCLSDALDQAQRKFLQILNDHTLADLFMDRLKSRTAPGTPDGRTPKQARKRTGLPAHAVAK